VLPKKVRAMSLGRLIDEFDNPESSHNKTEIINLIGCRLDELTKEKEKGEAFFRRLLKSDSESEKALALGHLGRIGIFNRETSRGLKEFFRNPANRVLAGKIEQALDQMISSSTH